ncbi:MAG: hypothetical protein U5J97_06335 [Trueperaceae bacterium]|nr:hypothetical protein [Trueperaceae bacterium]
MLSTTSGAPAAWAASARAGRSGTCPDGLAIVSTQTPIVSGPAAARTASASGGTLRTRTPNGSSTFAATEPVPPNSWSVTSHSRPGEASASMIVVVAA